MTQKTVALRWVLSVWLLALAWPALGENSAAVATPKDDPKWIARHNAMAEQMKAGHAKVLWIGDSIVQKFEKPGKPVWDTYYAPRDAINLGISGDRTEHVLWRLDHCNLEYVSPKLAIVMIGQNNGGSNTAEEIAEGVEAIVTKLRKQQPQMKVLLLGIFFRGEKPNDEQVKLAKTNEMLSRWADGKQVVYMNVNGIFIQPDGIIMKALMPDFEHPNEEGCKRWAEAIEPQVAKMLDETPIGSGDRVAAPPR